MIVFIQDLNTLYLGAEDRKSKLEAKLFTTIANNVNLPYKKNDSAAWRTRSLQPGIRYRQVLL